MSFEKLWKFFNQYDNKEIKHKDLIQKSSYVILFPFWFAFWILKFTAEKKEKMDTYFAMKYGKFYMKYKMHNNIPHLFLYKAYAIFTPKYLRDWERLQVDFEMLMGKAFALVLLFSKPEILKEVRT